MRLLIKNGRVIDPANGVDAQLDILVEDGKISAIQAGLVVGEGCQVLEATGKIVAPGFVDMHVHLREPGYEYKETIATGTGAAAMGGFTSVACMPNTNPVADNGAVITLIKEKARVEGRVNVFPIGAITKGSAGKELTEVAELVDAGAVALSDDGQPVMNSQIMRQAMEYSRPFDLPIISHCEDKNLSAGGAMHEGYISTILGLKGIVSVAEEAMVARDIMLAELTGARVHIAHVSTAGSVRLLRDAKERGIAVTAEATPHHFSLTDEAVRGYNTNTKVNPPLRSAEDVQAVVAGLADGTIDCIATDHAPHGVDDKEVEFDYAPFGIVGMETAVPLAVTKLIRSGKLDWSRLVALFSVNPCRILNVPGGSLKVGNVADITVIDPDLKRTVSARDFVSKGKNCPFDGWELYGWPVATIVGGRVVMKDGELL